MYWTTSTKVLSENQLSNRTQKPLY